MRTVEHLEQNRPVHLARRDVYFEKAAELIFASENGYTTEAGQSEYEEILFLLQVARLHARFSIRDAGKNERDEQFCMFIDLLSGNVKAILSMLNLKTMVQGSDGSLSGFLSGNHASIVLQSEEYQRRANDIVRSILNTLRLADQPFKQLKEEHLESVSPEELERYHKAREHFVNLVQEGRYRYFIASSLKKVSPDRD